MKPEEIERFQKWLQRQLNERNLTANQLAKKAGISHSVFVRVREGKLPKAKTCFKIADALDVDPAEVLRAASLISQISEKEEDFNRIVFMFNRLSPEKKRLAINIIRSFSKKGLTTNEQGQEHEEGDPTHK